MPSHENCNFWKRIIFCAVALAVWFTNLAICTHFTTGSFGDAAFGAFILTAIIDFCLFLVIFSE